MSVAIRTATAADVESVLAVWREARATPPRTPDDPAAVERLLARDTGALLVAEDEGQVVGALIAGWDGWRGNVYRLAVIPSRRRAGIGRRLVEAGHDRLRALGAPRVTALVGGEEGAPIGLWRTLGYQRDELVNRFVRDL